jgi:hypothetical protein
MNFNGMNIDYGSVMQALSSTLQATMTAFNNPTFRRTTQELLSNLSLTQAFTLSSIDQVTAALSSIPMHPYQRLLWEYFEPDHKFKTIDDVPEPDFIPVDETLKYIEQKTNSLNQTALHNLTCCPEQQIRTGFGFLSAGEVVYDLEKQKNYLEFFEMVRRIDPQTLTMENINTINKKIIAEYLKVI